MAMSTEFTELFPNLPEESALECLIRLNYVARRIGALVCRRWPELLLSRDFFYHQKRTEFTQKAAVMVQSIPYPDGLPLLCQVVSSEGKLVTRRRDMPSCRSFFAAAGVVFVAGGHDVNKIALSTAWKYDIRADEWTELPGMNEERD
ncbi:hypothetical protein C3L33_02720, partial [Rhododendron williamsianum]